MSEPLVRGAIVNELGVAWRSALEIANEELRAEGVDPAEYHPLSFIGVMQPVTRTQLTAATGYPRTTVRDILRAVIERGHARERPNPHDGRSTLLELTPKGQAIFDRGIPAFKRALQRIDAALGGNLDEQEDAVRAIRIALQAELKPAEAVMNRLALRRP
jgi:DNA-binding MarR family transcriptional regulator